MPAPKQTTSRARRDKGTRGGRPEPAPAAQARRGAAQPARPPGPARAGTATASAAAPATRIAPLWLQLTTWALSFLGLGVSIYLTITHYDTAVTLVCSDKGLVNCGLVTSSPESMVFGIFPVAVLGLAFYVFLVAATSPWAWRSKYPQVAMARLVSIIVGIGFVLYLVYAELFTLDHICLWCTSVHVITFLLFVLILVSAAVGYGFRDPDRA
ncbi:MAG TPA: vitamin K epoxide reductase family protein [Streptosporangiaceae bacterium]|nr:vitamin K epoxide reductase family protein [Streptosporangiaceae bacterium]